MNKCIVIGKIIGDTIFKFMYNSNKISIAICKVKLNNESEIICYRI